MLTLDKRKSIFLAALLTLLISCSIITAYAISYSSTVKFTVPSNLATATSLDITVMDGKRNVVSEHIGLHAEDSADFTFEHSGYVKLTIHNSPSGSDSLAVAAYEDFTQIAKFQMNSSDMQTMTISGRTLQSGINGGHNEIHLYWSDAHISYEKLLPEENEVAILCPSDSVDIVSVSGTDYSKATYSGSTKTIVPDEDTVRFQYKCPNGQILHDVSINKQEFIISKDGSISPSCSFLTAIPNDLGIDSVYFDTAAFLKENTLKASEITFDFKSSTIEKSAVQFDSTKAAQGINEVLKAICDGTYSGTSVDATTKNAIQSAHASGKQVTFLTSITPADRSSISENDVKLLTDAEKDVTGNVSTLDISVAVLGNGSPLGKLSEIPTPITFTVDVSSFVKEGRTFSVHTVHNGCVSKVDSTLSADGLLTFSTSTFSLYSISYKDATSDVHSKTDKPTTPTPTPIPKPSVPDTTESDTPVIASAKTADAGMTSLYILLMVSTVGILICFRKLFAK